MNRRGTALLLSSLVIALAGCSGGGQSSEASGGGDSTAARTPEPTSSTNLTTRTTAPKPSPTPTRETVETHQIGDLIESPTANITVNAIEQRDSISGPDGPVRPDEGERLWYVDITWTNNLPEAVSKECHGPYSMDLQAFDIQGREMLMTDQPGFIEGQECSTGLMQGQTGTWLTAFHGLDADFGWLAFDDYNGEPIFVVRDPSVTLSRD